MDSNGVNQNRKKMTKFAVLESVLWKRLEQLPTDELEDLVGTCFSFNANASEDFIKDFHARQSVAQSIIDRRIGRLERRDPAYVWRDKSKDPSIWTQSKLPPEEF